MIRSELYHKTVDILTAAYFNDTLEHGNCAACAVGNMVAHGMNYKFTRKYGGLNWLEVDAYDETQVARNWFNVIFHRTQPNERQRQEIESTGYDIYELTQIESAFENADEGDSSDEYMFNGLMAVIDVLDEIHENKDTAITEKSKKSFVKPVVCQI
jgi:hypothetical protein